MDLILGTSLWGWTVSEKSCFELLDEFYKSDRLPSLDLDARMPEVEKLLKLGKLKKVPFKNMNRGVEGKNTSKEDSTSDLLSKLDKAFNKKDKTMK